MHKQIVGSNNQNTSRVVCKIKLKSSHTLLSTTSVHFFSNGGVCVFRGAFFPWGGGGVESTRQWGGGRGAHLGGGGSCEEFGVDTGRGGGLM